MRRIVGIGLDLVDIERFSAALERHGESLVRRICREGESKPLTGRARTAHLAGLFAAKEAAMKALGTGWAAGIGFRQIEVRRAESGAPQLRFHDAAAMRAERLGVVATHLTITHDARSAAAVAIFEGGTE